MLAQFVIEKQLGGNGTLFSWEQSSDENFRKWMLEWLNIGGECQKI